MTPAGDYDFNDAVIAYDAIKVITTKEIESNNQITKRCIKILRLTYCWPAIEAME